MIEISPPHPSPKSAFALSRPLIGAALTLVVYLAVTGKLIAITGIGANPLNLEYPDGIRVEFAERAFVRQFVEGRDL